MKKKTVSRPYSGFSKIIVTSILLLVFSILSSGCAIHPKPLLPDELRSEADKMRLNMATDQEPVTGPIDIYEAMARAVKYNLNYRLKLMEEAIGLDQTKLAKFDLLPKMTASAGYAKRSNVRASISESIATGDISLEASTSEEKKLKTAGLALSWNILDFGVSYYQAKQQTNKYLILSERRRKAVHNLLSDIRYAFWRAAAVEHLHAKIKSAKINAEKALEYAVTVEKERLKPMLEILTYQKVLLEVTRKMELLEQELALAKVELAHLMNLMPGTEFELKIPSTDKIRLLKYDDSLRALENMALQQRPELKEIHYQKRISVDETRKSIASLFPGINFTVGTNYDSNKYIINNSWSDIGTRLAWNLMDLVSAPQRIKLAKSQEGMLEMQQKTLSMAVLSQLHIAYRQYKGFVRQLERDTKLENVNEKIFQKVESAYQADTQSRIEKIRAETNAIMARLQRFHSFAQLQNALGRAYASIGLDPLPENYNESNVSTLSGTIRQKLEKWDNDFTVPSRH
ncbi:MAG: TolC family protein [Desulfobacteraceae bacterium]|jgi:outer membrane protein TolC